jgi:LPS-assembly protein
VALGLLLAAVPRAAELPSLGSGADAPDEETPVLLLADEVTYDRELGIAVARGNVEVSQKGRVLKADTLTYNERTRTVTASGNVALMEPGGEVTFAEYAEVSDDLREGFIRNVGLLLTDRSRAVAASGVRVGGNRTILNKGVFSPCALCPEDPMAAPIWQLKAVKVIHDQEEKTIQYQDAWMEIYGVPVFYTPYLSHPDPTVTRKTGLLMPSVGQSSELGWLAQVPVFLVLSDDKDLTLSPTFTTKQSVVLAGEYRERFQDGRMRIGGSATIADREHESGGVTVVDKNQLRGHLDATGDFDIDEHWRWGFDALRSSDKTYLRLYQISNAAYLTSRLFAEGFYDRSYITGQAFAFQGLRSGDDDGEAPFITPDALVNYVGEPDTWGGYFNVDAGTAILTRTDGRDMRRLHFKGGYHLPYTAPAGDVYTLDASLVADGYWVDGVDTHSDDVNPPPGDIFSGLTGRILPQIYGEWRYPFVRRHERASQIFEPIIGLALAPPGQNPGKIPNEDSLEFEFDETHLFDPDRFAGEDRVDSGGRLDYGVKWSLLGERGGYTSLLLGQSLRLYGDSEFAIDTGLEDTLSDVVGKFEFQPTYNVNLSYRFRYDISEGKLDRSEAVLSAGPPIFNVDLTYSFADTGNSSTQAGTEQAVASVHSQLSDHWSASAAARFDIQDARVLSEGMSIGYSDECFNVRLSAQRSFYTDEEIEPSTTFLITVGFKYLGTFGVPVGEIFGSGEE